MDENDELRRLVDRAEIQQLQSEYAFRFDSHDLDGVVELYAPDGAVRVGDEEPIRGHAALREMYEGMNALMGEWSHHYTNSWIRITSDTTAEGRLYWLVPANWSNGRAHLQAGHYHDAYVKIDGLWRIQERVAGWFWSRYMEWEGNWSQAEPMT